MTSRPGDAEDDPSPEHGAAAPLLCAAEARAVRRFLARVRREVPARLVQASLFGSKARAQARPDSDIDILLIFHRLPWDREPFASQAEDIAEQVARASGVPVTTWSVSLVDLRPGNRTPMLVDALDDSVPLWWERHPLRPVPFTPADALRCVDALLTRVSEGSEEFRQHLRAGRPDEAARRARDDVVRLCTAALLLRGVTRPRRGEAVLRARRDVWGGERLPGEPRRILRWAADAFGPDLRDEDAEVPPLPGGPAAVARAVDFLARRVVRDARRLGAREAGGGP